MNTGKEVELLPGKTDVQSVHRSPHSFEIVDPTNEKVDRRSLPENIEKRVRGHLASTVDESTQLFVNNILADEAVTEAEAVDPDRLYNASAVNPPNFAIISEKPEHRLIVYLKAQGLSNKEVADKTGYTQSWVSQITRQPWFRLRLTIELKEAGLDQVQTVLKASALDSVWTLVDLRDDTTAPKAVRKSCADSLLDRFLGKATQRVEHEEKRLPSSPEISAIDTELNQIETQLNDKQTPVTDR